MTKISWVLLGCALVGSSFVLRARAQSCEPTEQRPGLCNPLGEPPAEPVLRDDEAIVVGFDDGTQTFAVQDSLGDEPGLRVLAQREGGEPVIARGGRVLGVPIEQLVLISRSGDGFVLELLSMDACVPDLPCPLVLGRYEFESSNPSSEVSLDVADVLEERPGSEIVLGFETEQSGQARMAIALLSFSRAGSRDLADLGEPIEPEVLGEAVVSHVHAGQDPALGYDLGLLRNQEGEPNHLRALGMQLTAGEPHAILVAHATPEGTVAVVALSIEALAGGEVEPSIVVDAFPLTEAAANAGSWDIALSRHENTAGDLLFLVRQASAQSLDVRALRFLRPPTPQCSVGDGDICGSGPNAGMPCESNDDCPSPPDTLEAHAEPFTSWLCTAGVNCPVIDLLDGRVHASVAPLLAPFHWNGPMQLVVTVQSTRGPLAQGFRLVGNEPMRLEPNESTTFLWPRGMLAIDARPTFEAPADVELSVANVIHHRATANRYGQAVSEPLAPFFYDREPSFYAVLPDAEPWSALGRLLRVRRTISDTDAEAESGPHCQGVACELRISDEDGAIDPFGTVVLATADIDGDSGYYHVPVRASGTSEFDLYLAPPTQLTLYDLAAPEIILEEPPKHVDYLRASGEGRIHNVSQSPEFSVAYRNATTESVQVQRESKVSYAFGESTETKVGAKMSGAVKIFTASAETSLTERVSRDLEMSESMLSLDSMSTTLTQTFETSNDDQLYVVERTVDIWRFPAIGLTNEQDAEVPRHPFLDLIVPGAGARSAQSGRNAARYSPRHINGNVLSYPRFESTSDISDAATSELQAFSVGGSCENALCDGGPNDGLACTDVLECVAPEPLSTPLWAESSFDVSADTTTTLVLSDAQSLGTQLAYSDTIAESSSYHVGGELGFAYMGFGASVSGSEDYTVSEKHTFASSELTTNATSIENEIALKAPPLGAPEETYAFAPAFYFERTGAVKVSHHVQLPTGAASFWSLHYGGPDPALHLPHRIVCSGEDCRLNTGAGRHAMKGLRVLLDAEDERDRHVVVRPPKAGTPLRVQAQIWNLGVGDSTGELTVRFEVALEGDDAHDERIEIGEAVIDDLEAGAITTAEIAWDTTGLGDEEGGSLDYRIWVTLDPENAIDDETHEWLDRDDDALLDEGGEELDPRTDPATGEGRFLEKGQNNEGWSSITIGPSDETCATLPDGCPDAPDDGDDEPGDDEPVRDGSVPDLEDGGVSHDAGTDGGDRDASADGGCGCSVPGAHAQTGGGALTLLALGLSWLRLRRRRR